MMVFEGHRGEVTERAVASRWVIEGLDVVEDKQFGVAAAGRERSVQSGFGFEGAPERFHVRIVVPDELHPFGQLKRNSPSRSRIHSIRGGGGVWNWSTASGDGDGGESIT
jgi:hypothetical protein